jgi:hypothetical protein
MTPTGRIPPGRLRSAVRKHQIELGLTEAQIAKILTAGDREAHNWLTYNTTPCAVVLLEAERWVWDLEHPQREGT